MRADTEIISNFEGETPNILQEKALEGFELKTNSFLTKELDFELSSSILELDNFILMSDEDEEGALATMDGDPKRRSRISTMSLAGL